jgi:hypothetical protein
MLTYAAVTFTGWGLGFSPLLLVLIDLIIGFSVGLDYQRLW